MVDTGFCPYGLAATVQSGHDVTMVESDEHQDIVKQLKDDLFTTLKNQGDPRMDGKGEIFDNYPYSGKSTDRFYERFMSGEKVKAGWVNPTDFEEGPLE